MFRCKMINFLFKIFPLKIWQDFLIRHHIQKCTVCQREMANVEEIKPFLTQESDVEGLEGLWPSIKARLGEEKRKERLSFWTRLRWATGVAGVLVAFVVGIWLYSIFSSEKGPSEENLVETFQINYINVGNKPARAYIFWPHDSKMIIIWAEKNI